MTKLKVVHIIQSLETGGAEKLLVDISINYKDKFEVFVISQYKKGNYQYENILESEGIKTIFLDKKKGYDYNNLKAVYKTLDKIKPDIVHTHLHAAIYLIPWYVKNKNVVKIHTVHTLAKMEFGKSHRLIQKFAYKFLGVIPVAIGTTVKKSIIKEYKLQEDKIKTITNGIDYKKYALLTNEKIEKSVFRIINVASFSKWKNQICLLEAFKLAIKQKEDMELIFVGDGPERKRIEAKSKELDIDDKVIFIGITDKVEYFLHISDVFVLCSKFEGLPLSIIEAYAAGLPVISTNVGGVPDILVDGENGFLVSADDKKSIANLIIKLYNEIELKEKISKNNREKAKEYDIKNISQKYMELYKIRYGEKDD